MEHIADLGALIEVAAGVDRLAHGAQGGGRPGRAVRLRRRAGAHRAHRRRADPAAGPRRAPAGRARTGSTWSSAPGGLVHIGARVPHEILALRALPDGPDDARPAECQQLRGRPARPREGSTLTASTQSASPRPARTARQWNAARGLSGHLDVQVGGGHNGTGAPVWGRTSRHASGSAKGSRSTPASSPPSSVSAPAMRPRCTWQTTSGYRRATSSRGHRRSSTVASPGDSRGANPRSSRMPRTSRRAAGGRVRGGGRPGVPVPDDLPAPLDPGDAGLVRGGGAGADQVGGQGSGQRPVLADPGVGLRVAGGWPGSAMRAGRVPRCPAGGAGPGRRRRARRDARARC